jgi:predicted nucleotidyltransferase
MAKEEIIILIKKYIDLLNAEGLSVKKAYLFGSYSVGTETDMSDIDVMIISDKFDETDDFAVGKMWQLTRRIDTKIEPFLIGMKKFKEDDTSPLLNTVRLNGLEIQ